MFVDVDGLKAINDSRGHRAGDAALIHVAQILARSLRTTDVVARLGGDEFGLLLEHLDEPQARAKAEKLADAVAAEPFEFAGERLPLCISIGVTAIRTGDDAELVLARADSEMYGLRSRATAQRSDR
jgi:diguanylate cyclase (GGDEF)-like protein